MDGVGLAFAVPGLVHECVDGYRAVLDMIARDKDMKRLRLQTQVEASRLELWSSYWGVLPDDTTRADRLRAANDQSFEEFLEIAGKKELIESILVDMKETLEKLLPTKPSLGASPSQDAKSKNQFKTFLAWQSPVKVRERLRWVISEKAEFEGNVELLRKYNNGLHDLLPRHPKMVLGQALLGQVMSAEKMVPSGSDLKILVSVFDGEASYAKNKPPASDDTATNTLPMSNDAAMEGEMHEAEGSTINDAQYERTHEEVESMQLRLDDLVDLKPQEFDFSLAKIKQKDGDVLEPVLIEWRVYRHTEDTDQIAMALDAKFEAISQLFKQKSDSREHYVLTCLGYVVVEGQERIGIVFRMPENCSAAPRTLQSIMQEDVVSNESCRPDLDERLMLARRLCVALYELQCCGWLHRQISSSNVLIFSKRAPGADGREKPDFSRPYLAGWQTARQDDQDDKSPTEGYKPRRRPNPFNGDILPYIHPQRPATRFKRSYDVYSLGVVLSEIAFWEPASGLQEDESWSTCEVGNAAEAGILKLWSRKIIETCDLELGGEVGRRYRAAVLWCLKGVHEGLIEQLISGKLDADEVDKEVGLEKAFFWQVLNNVRLME